MPHTPFRKRDYVYYDICTQQNKTVVRYRSRAYNIQFGCIHIDRVTHTLHVDYTVYYIIPGLYVHVHTFPEKRNRKYFHKKHNKKWKVTFLSRVVM